MSQIFISRSQVDQLGELFKQNAAGDARVVEPDYPDHEGYWEIVQDPVTLTLRLRDIEQDFYIDDRRNMEG